MKMIVGLGNPGQKYVGTRHNIGFEVLGEYARSHLAPTPRAKFQGEYSEIRVGTEKVILLCPLTYMNLSGQCVSQAASFFQIEPIDILVVCDDFHLNVERLRFRPSGSAGGQNGLNDIIKRLGTQDFPRLRVGIGPVPERWNSADFVLGKFTSDELTLMTNVIRRTKTALNDWVKLGIQHCMSHYNQATQKPGDSKVNQTRPEKKQNEEKKSAKNSE